MAKKLTLLFLGLVAICIVIMMMWYRIDGLPTEASASYMSGQGYTTATETDGSLIFEPLKPNGYGIVIMHGALILPQSYSQSAAYFAQRGYTVYLPKGPGRLSITAVDSTATRMQEWGLAGWFFIGHSMGGMTSLETISRHNIDALGVALWATAMPSDYSHVDVPMLFIWGDTDGLLPAHRFRDSQKNLPANVEYLTLAGANHKNFARYSHQFFDNDATLEWNTQIEFANNQTAEFFARQLPVNLR
jgi:pimeloyl-ACP methyl ester carboxylesterase